MSTLLLCTWYQQCLPQLALSENFRRVYEVASSSVSQTSDLSVFIFSSLVYTQVTMFGFFSKHILKYLYLIILLVLQKQPQGCSLGSHVYLINSWNGLFIMNFSLDQICLVCSPGTWTIHTSPFTDFANFFNLSPCVCRHACVCIHTSLGFWVFFFFSPNSSSPLTSFLTLHAALRSGSPTCSPGWNMVPLIEQSSLLADASLLTGLKQWGISPMSNYQDHSASLRLILLTSYIAFSVEFQMLCPHLTL